MNELKIGSPVWIGKHEYQVTRETSRSWVVETRWREEYKIPKKHKGPVVEFPSDYGTTYVWLDKTAMEQTHWVSENRWRLARLMESCRDFSKLRRIEMILAEPEEVR